jgi:hypothetical protein
MDPTNNQNEPEILTPQEASAWLDNFLVEQQSRE